MKRTLLIGVLIMLVLSLGCLGGQTTTTSTGISPSPSPSPTGTSHTTTTTPVNQKSFNPLKALSSIERFFYRENATVTMNVTIYVANTTQKSFLKIRVLEEGYVDTVKRVAVINSTTVTIPDNVTVKVERVIVGDQEFVKTPAGNMKVSNSSLVGSFWNTNPVALAKHLANTTPLAKYRKGNSTVLVYSAPGRLLLPLARVYFTSPGMNVTITDATVELYFENGTLVKERLIYSLQAVAVTSDPALGKMKVVERGQWKGTIEIYDINVKKNVSVPST